MTISIVIPALNERESLPATARAARAAFPDARIVVADGGSADGTREWVVSQSDLQMIDCPVRGRGPQMNAGAAQAGGDVLLFLHADCLLPADARRAVEAALADPRVVGGCFGVRFTETRPRSLPFTAALINAQSRLRRRATGDQGIFVRRGAWDQCGEYKLWPLFEDIDFVTRLKRVGDFRVVREKVTISARRWLEFGVGRTSLLMVALWIAYRLGVSPVRLKRWFSDIRPHLTRKP